MKKSNPFNGKENDVEHKRVIFWLFVIASLIFGYDTLSHLRNGIGDEGVHSFQIYWFINGNYQIFEHLTMPPVYHSIIALMGKAFGTPSMNNLRFVHMLFAACCIPVFYHLVRRTYPDQAYLRTLQFIYIPFLFPLFFLIYTDIPSLIFTLAMMERTLRKKYVVAAGLGLVSVSIRQPNLVWVAYACVLVLLDGQSFSYTRGYFVSAGKKLLPYILVFLAFAVFVLVNGGIAIGDAEQHPISLNLSNLYFFLIVCFALFLPYNVTQLKSIYSLIIANKWVMVILVAGFFVYMATYAHPHKYNTYELSYYRHNLVLYWTSDIKLVRLLSYVAISWMALSFVVTAIKSKYKWQLLFMYPFAAMSFVPLPLIEHRYYIPAICLFMIFRPSVNIKIDALTLCYYLLASGYILFNISRATFFL